MNFNKSANLALWLIFLLLLIPYVFNNRFIPNFLIIKNLSEKKLKEETKSFENSENNIELEDLQKERFIFRHELYIFTSIRAKKICTSEFVNHAVLKNLENQKILMKKMKDVVPNYIKFDWKPYSFQKMSSIIRQSDCIDKYKEIILPYAQELEVKSKLELLKKEPYFYKTFFSMFSWDPDWPNCPEFGYPACKKISYEKWKSIAIEDD